MHKGFWDENKNAVQLVILLNALCGIFLNIPRPSNKTALSNLNNLQMFLLLLASVSMIYLFIKIYRWAVYIEMNLKNSWRSFDEVLTVGIGMGGLWFLINLWEYIFSTYSSSIRAFINISIYPLMLVFISVYVFLLSKIRIRGINISKDSKSTASILFAIGLALPFSMAWVELFNWSALKRGQSDSLLHLAISVTVWTLVLSLSYIFLAQKQPKASDGVLSGKFKQGE